MQKAKAEQNKNKHATEHGMLPSITLFSSVGKNIKKMMKGHAHIWASSSDLPLPPACPIAGESHRNEHLLAWPPVGKLGVD